MASISRSGSAHWEGGGKDGTGHVSTQSGVLQQAPYGFNTRFAEGNGTNPEELIAAAHAGCFTMALAFQLAGADLKATSLDTSAKVGMDQVEGGWKIARVALTLKARIPGCDETTFRELAEVAKANCPVSKVLNAEITLEATLEA